MHAFVALFLVAGFTPQYPCRVLEQRSRDIVAAWEFDEQERRKQS